MAKKIEINGKKYDVAPMNLNTICELEDNGVSLADFGKKQLSFVRGYAAICMGVDVDTAGKEVEAHLVSGKTLEDISKVIQKEIEESGFFQAMQKNTAETDSAE